MSLSVAVGACGSDKGGSGLPWQDQRTQIVADDRVFAVSPAVGNACIDYQGQCLKPADKCGQEAADIVLDANGKLVDVLCYPAAGTWTVEDLTARAGEIPQHDNNTVLVLDSLDDGADIVGDVSIDANNVVIYGDSPDTAVLAGSLELEGNNTLIRGVRIQGDVTVNTNNSVLAFCVIEGDLTISGNNTKLLGCDVFGTTTITGNNTQLYANRFAGDLSSTGKNADCIDNHAAADVNVDLHLEASELGAALSCK